AADVAYIAFFVRRIGAAAAIAAYIALLIGMLVIGAPAQQAGIVGGLWITEALAISLPAVCVLVIVRVRFGPWLGLHRITWKHALVAIGAAAANQPVVSFLTWVMHTALPSSVVAEFDAKQRMLDAVFGAHAVPMVITVTIAAPLGEELFFRGFAFPALSRSWGLVAGVLVSGALFSFLHMDPVGFVGLMEIGILLAALRHWSGSLWAAVLGHAVNNGIAGGAFLMGYEDPDLPPPVWVLAVGGVLFAIGVWLLVRVLRKPSPAPAVAQPRERSFAAAGVLGAVWLLAVFWGAWTLTSPRG
ncbi:MAG TPA: type II CAAX endopeptidase family protein, partial [Myxococcales bacterium]|nr:type II CAAX endopeptidase family protein [Myxococcales bacterium]